MDDNAKAKTVIEAFEQVADDFRNEGKPDLATRTMSALKDVPVGSLAKLHDILKLNPTKAAALRSVGADA